jgi:amidase
MRIFVKLYVTLLRISGYVSWVGKVAERDAVLTEILLECGAVLYVRTNVPQTLMV